MNILIDEVASVNKKSRKMHLRENLRNFHNFSDKNFES